jgi:hypothetical protein
VGSNPTLSAIEIKALRDNGVKLFLCVKMANSSFDNEWKASKIWMPSFIIKKMIYMLHTQFFGK